jgi:hypothetical protein
MTSKPYRVTIAGFLGFISLLAIGFAALRSPSAIWASGVFSLAVITLILAVVAACELRGPRRSFWRAFALCGWLYLGLTCTPWTESQIGSRLVTTSVMEILYARYAPPTIAPGWGPGTAATTVPANVWGPGTAPTTTVSTSGSGVAASGTGSFTSSTIIVQTASPAPTVWESWSTPVRLTRQWAAPWTGPLEAPDTFRYIGHSVVSLLFAALGGVIARWLYGRAERDERATDA